ncbi:Reverse transcriptase domain [Trinorchestia longiramus]|nr:Reverse transcriptase domain [Trinorchestia longiramus]
MALRKRINETKRKHFQKELQTAKKNPKRTWEIIKEIAQYKDIKEEKKFENPLETATNFNTFFSEVGAKVFDKWKYSIFKPLHKAGDINTASNYMPISLLPVVSKILEKVISNHLLTHLDKSNLLHPNRYTYRKHTSTQDALLNITEKIYSDIDTKNVTLLLLLDLSEAFDSVEHKRLLQKISILGIATQWFQSYLANCSHAVRLENTISSPIQNDFGVPQGSILGPLLFLIFINDFPSMPSNMRISMHADDVQIAMTSLPAKLSQTKSNAEILLKHVISWYDQNGLKLNASKTQCIIFGSKNTIKKLPNLTLTLGNDIIEPVEVKNLGVWFD